MFRFALVTALSLVPALAGADGVSGRDRPSGNAWTGPTVIEQRDAGYLAAVEHAARAQRALQVALDELAASRAMFPFPGFDYLRIEADLATAREALVPMLAPEQRRLRYQTLVPDGVYMRVPTTELSPHH